MVNLTDPDKTIIVQLCKGQCALSVVSGYKRFAKFNLLELSQKVPTHVFCLLGSAQSPCTSCYKRSSVSTHSAFCECRAALQYPICQHNTTDEQHPPLPTRTNAAASETCTALQSHCRSYDPSEHLVGMGVTLKYCLHTCDCSSRHA